MNKRIFLVGLIGGLLVSAAALYPLYRYLPSGFVEGWPAANSKVAIFWTGLAAILLLATGIVAARVSGTRNRFAAAGAGAVSGLIASLLVELSLGGAAASVWGSRLILAHGLHATQDETEYMYLFSHGVTSILWWGHLAIWIAAAAGILLGGLGGLVAGPGGKPARPQPEFWLTVSVTMVLPAALLFILSIYEYSALSHTLQNVADKYSLSLPYPSEAILALPVATSLVWLVLWQLAAWFIARRTPSSQRINFLFAVAMAIVVSFVIQPFVHLLTVPIVQTFPAGVKPPAPTYLCVLMSPVPLVIFERSTIVSLIIDVVLLVFATGLVWVAINTKFQPHASLIKEARPSRPWNRVKIFFRDNGLKVTAWYLLFIAILTAILVFLTDRDSFRLPWLSGGLALSVFLAILGIRDTGKAIPVPSEEADTPIPWHSFATVSLSGFFSALIPGLHTLALLGLAMIPLDMIPVLSYHDESKAIAAAGMKTVAKIVSMNYEVAVGMAIRLGIRVLILALLVTAVSTFWSKLRSRDMPPELVSHGSGGVAGSELSLQ